MRERGIIYADDTTNARPARCVLDWLARSWVLALVLVVSMVAAWWLVSQKPGKYGFRRLYGWSGQLSDGGYRRITVESWSGGYDIQVTTLSNDVPQSVREAGGSSSPDMVLNLSEDAGRLFKSAHEYLPRVANSYRSDLLWEHSARYHVHHAVPVFGAVGLFLLSLSLRPVRQASAWWLGVLRRGRTRPKPRGFPVEIRAVVAATPTSPSRVARA